MKRVIFDIILFISVFILPWWISAILLLVGIFLFKQFYEFIIASLVMYSLFSAPNSSRLISNPFFITSLIGLVYVGVQLLKVRMIVYKNEI